MSLDEIKKYLPPKLMNYNTSTLLHNIEAH